MKAFAVLATGALALAACGGDGGGGSEQQAYVDAMMRSFESSDAPFTREEARCVAGRMVDTIGVDTLRESDITPENVDDDDAFDKLDKDLDRSRAEDLADAIFDGECLDVVDLLTTSMDDSTFSQVPEAKRRCFVEGIVETEVFRDAIVASLLGQDAEDRLSGSGSELFSVMGDCEINPNDLGG